MTPHNHLISLTGAGPGSIELLTLKAAERIRHADVILYDALHGEEILSLAHPDARKIYVGKHYQDGQHQDDRQEWINSLLLDYARAGNRIVRLKTGDPFIFGRGAEELAFCRANSLNVEVIPGITAGLAAAAQFGIPLTQRGTADMLMLYTGHTCQARRHTLPVVAAALQQNSPVLLYMGLKTLPDVAAELIGLGVNSAVTVDILSRIGHPDEQQFSTTLAAVADFLQQEAPPLPAVIILKTPQ
ncbi:MAG: uroporphyrinogen-III C-methyltransferase [Bacteroidales bacterium]|jgi:uroporphyrin-III C-methyltransferase|nr:uroporphyrinogen-III C-methyltransferase [Bacteroidales bacterium]